MMLTCLWKDENGGKIVAAATWHEKENKEVIVAEARTIMLAVVFAKNCCFRKIIIESDCETLIKAIYQLKESIHEHLGIHCETNSKKSRVF